MTKQFFSYSADDGFEFHTSETEARTAAENMLKAHRAEAEHVYEWPDNTDDICWGRLSARAIEHPCEDSNSVDYSLDEIASPERMALREWLDKTDWVQKSSTVQELGMHRADVLRKRIQALEAKPATVAPNIRAARDAIIKVCEALEPEDWCGDERMLSALSRALDALDCKTPATFAAPLEPTPAIVELLAYQGTYGVRDDFQAKRSERHQVFCRDDDDLKTVAAFADADEADAKAEELNARAAWAKIAEACGVTLAPDAVNGPVSPDESNWCNWVAQMIGGYLRMDIDDERIPHIAAVMRNRLWGFPRPKAKTHNPYTGTPRDPRDIASDPQGVLIVERLGVATPTAGPTNHDMCGALVDVIERMCDGLENYRLTDPWGDDDEDMLKEARKLVAGAREWVDIEPSAAERAALELYRPPFLFACEYVTDSKGEPVCLPAVSAELGRMIATALTAYWGARGIA